MNKSIINRLRRLEGQIRGLQKIVAENDCEKTMIQFKASQAALEKCFSLFLKKNLEECLQKKQTKKLDQILHFITKK